MTNKCKNCNRVINDTIVLNCTCGTFCSQECLNDYHHKDKVFNEFIEKLKDRFKPTYGRNWFVWEDIDKLIKGENDGK